MWAIAWAMVLGCIAHAKTLAALTFWALVGNVGNEKLTL